MLRFAMVLALALNVAGAVVAAAQGGCVVPAPDDLLAPLARTDHSVSGNRIASGCGPLEGAVTDVELGGVPAWVLPDPSDRGRSWFVVLDDGTVEHVVTDGSGGAFVSESGSPPLEPGQPPLALATAQDQVAVGSALGASGWFVDPLPDARVTETSAAAQVALAGPTDRYDHGVLGDELEASAIDVRGEAGPMARIAVGLEEVIEGTSAMVVDFAADGDGPALLVTISDARDGARLRLYGFDGDVVAESEPIGQGYRWLHQVGVGRLAPDAELEIIAVRTPHIGGRVEAYRLVGDRLELAASIEGYSSHQLGSANLDMALLADVDGDGRLDVVVPRQDMGSLGVLRRTDDGFEESGRLGLDGGLTTNVAATSLADGGLALAAGTADGRLRIFS